MNEIAATALEAYEPDKFYCANIPLSVLKRCFQLTPIETEIVHALLREYKYDLHEYKGCRQHVFNIRRKLSSSMGVGAGVISFGLEFYAIPDEVKKKIVKHILAQPGTSVAIETKKAS